jgi:hypothetical protein
MNAIFLITSYLLHANAKINLEFLTGFGCFEINSSEQAYDEAEQSNS